MKTLDIHTHLLNPAASSHREYDKIAARFFAKGLSVDPARLRDTPYQTYLEAMVKSLLQQTTRDQQIHRAQCNFQKKPGQIYHLYQNRHGNTLLSMLLPDDWQGKIIKDKSDHLKAIHQLLSDQM
ncbi:DUF2452 domain-containing protein [Candidatus Thiodiazotropha endoloripes]|uniref:Uncharacterized protein n=1 Tax=Candidatus Thiodiazotropha endoloripes TaxID=1818881 RepID=A0A1E2ULV2_9GAMM|nr:DUF2452 domain-containing protein [Candidatus Thiodiazotropha endoloripes]ODB95691.1 hypothetical protein A3196_02340 [Candidatus Thiodiazotropha endoloripes]